MKYLIAGLLMTSFCSSAYANIVTESVSYTQGEKTFTGYMAYDDSLKGPLPGVLVVHEWWGLNDYARKRTEQLAKMGYVAFAADMYGGGITTSDPQTASKWSAEIKETPLIRTRSQYALEQLKNHPRVDPKRIAAIGFCFGGTTVLELAWSGADLAGVVSFHGGLTSPKPEDMGHIKAKVLILHGAADPFNSHEAVTGIQDAMEKAKVDWQMIIYGGAEHGFTNPEADTYHIKGLAYSKTAAARSWKHMGLFFNEIFTQ
jgi:dienelactone hydrolase